jgi:hypothetical protein
MGYDLHITRAEDWSDPHGAHIALEEWLAVATADRELVAIPENGDAFFGLGSGADDAAGWFDWSQGNVYTKNPDEHVLAKMLTLASSLAARVQGDDGEFYDSPADLHDARLPQRQVERSKRQFWRARR